MRKVSVSWREFGDGVAYLCGGAGVGVVEAVHVLGLHPNNWHNTKDMKCNEGIKLQSRIDVHTCCMCVRPVLSGSLDEAEFRRWYYTMAELQPFAREVGLSASGPKAELNDRIAAFLGGRPIPKTIRKATNTPQLDDVLDRSTVIPNGQRSTVHLRAFFEAEIGPAFRFDGHMRKFLAESDGSTLGDAITHWHETRGQELPTQSKSLEFNAFTKEWHRHYPDGSATECRAAWDRFRSLPADERPNVADA